jgi:hypothetical protein
MHLIANLDCNPLGSTTRCFLNLKAVAFFLSPDKGLGPMNPGSPQFHMEPVHLLVPGSTAKAIPRFHHKGGEPTLLKITSSRDAGESSADHNNINSARHGERSKR